MKSNLIPPCSVARGLPHARFRARFNPSTGVLDAEVKQYASVRFRRMILNPDGSIAKRTKWGRNLILDSGLNAVAGRSWPACFEYCAIGTGTNPFIRDSGTVTFTVAAGVVTASSSFFEAGDTGRLLHLDSGEKGYLTYSSATSATWTGVDVGVASEGTVEYVNRTSLQTEVKRTNTYRTSGGDNGSSWLGSPNFTWTHQRTFLFTAEVGAVTYREAGWSWGSGGTNLFGGVVFSGGGDSLSAGQQYLLQVQLIVRVSPTAAEPQSNVATGGWDVTGDFALRSVQGFQTVNSSGGTTGANDKGLDPGEAYGTLKLATATFTLGSGPVNSNVASPTSVNDKSVSLESYTNGTFTRRKHANSVWSVSEANTTIYGLIYNTASGNMALAVLFDTPQVKDNEHTLQVYWRFTWDRDNAA